MKWILSSLSWARQAGYQWEKCQSEIIFWWWAHQPSGMSRPDTISTKVSQFLYACQKSDSDSVSSFRNNDSSIVETPALIPKPIRWNFRLRPSWMRSREAVVSSKSGTKIHFRAMCVIASGRDSESASIPFLWAASLVKMGRLSSSGGGCTPFTSSARVAFGSASAAAIKFAQFGIPCFDVAWPVPVRAMVDETVLAGSIVTWAELPGDWVGRRLGSLASSWRGVAPRSMRAGIILSSSLEETSSVCVGSFLLTWRHLLAMHLRLFIFSVRSATCWKWSVSSSGPSSGCKLFCRPGVCYLRECLLWVIPWS